LAPLKLSRVVNSAAKVDLLASTRRWVGYRAIGVLLLPANRLLNHAKIAKWSLNITEETCRRWRNRCLPPRSAFLPSRPFTGPILKGRFGSETRHLGQRSAGVSCRPALHRAAPQLSCARYDQLYELEKALT
jgi:hypothetical protein